MRQGGVSVALNVRVSTATAPIRPRIDAILAALPLLGASCLRRPIDPSHGKICSFFSSDGFNNHHSIKAADAPSTKEFSNVSLRRFSSFTFDHGPVFR